MGNNTDQEHNIQEGSQDLVETTHNDENDHEIPPAADLVIFSNRESAGPSAPLCPRTTSTPASKQVSPADPGMHNMTVAIHSRFRVPELLTMLLMMLLRSMIWSHRL